MKIQLHDNHKHLAFAPLTLTRPVGSLRMGIFTNAERWEKLIPEASVSYLTEDYLTACFDDSVGDVIVNACLIPDRTVVEAIVGLKNNEKLAVAGEWLAYKGTGEIMVNYRGEAPLMIENRWDLYQKNGDVIKNDFEIVTKGRTSVQLSDTNTIIGDVNLVFVEEGAIVEACILNTSNGPIYIGKDSEIMEGSIVRGPLAMCEASGLKMGSKIYGPTTIGPHCKVGGEVNNCVFQAYSNKGHDGFLGNSLIGEWCNLGADTNTSNLKNNYGMVKTYSYETDSLEQTEVQFMGLVMGDHSKCGINTMFNTATVVGVSSNIFGAGFPEKFVPSFKWGDHATEYNFDKAIESANHMMERRGKQLSDGEIAVLRNIADNK